MLIGKEERDNWAIEIEQEREKIWEWKERDREIRKEERDDCRIEVEEAR